MLRPVAWLNDRQVKTGGSIEINVHECGIEGLADVLDVETCPSIDSGPGRVVTATFHSSGGGTRTPDTRIMIPLL